MVDENSNTNWWTWWILWDDKKNRWAVTRGLGSNDNAIAWTNTIDEGKEIAQLDYEERWGEMNPSQTESLLVEGHTPQLVWSHDTHHYATGERFWLGWPVLPYTDVDKTNYAWCVVCDDDKARWSVYATGIYFEMDCDFSNPVAWAWTEAEGKQLAQLGFEEQWTKKHPVESLASGLVDRLLS